MSTSEESSMTTRRPVALVTGASSGIGEAASLALVEAGFEVVGTSRHTANVTPRKGVTLLDLDVASDASVAAAVGQVIDPWGGSTCSSTTPVLVRRAPRRRAL